MLDLWLVSANLAQQCLVVINITHTLIHFNTPHLTPPNKKKMEEVMNTILLVSEST